MAFFEREKSIPLFLQAAETKLACLIIFNYIIRVRVVSRKTVVGDIDCSQSPESRN